MQNTQTQPQRTYSADHPYHKEANSFIRGIKKRQEYIASQKALQVKIGRIKHIDFGQKIQLERELRKINGSHIRLNRKLARIKYSYWAVEPTGERFYLVYPELKKR